MLEFNILTPLPWLRGPSGAVAQGRRHGLGPQQVRSRACRHRPSEDEPRRVEAIYQEAWSLYYTREHVETLLRRATVTKVPMMSLVQVLVQFTVMMQIEKIHPLQSGLIRCKHRGERRPGLPRESAWAFYSQYMARYVCAESRARSHRSGGSLASSAASSAIPTASPTPTRRSRR